MYQGRGFVRMSDGAILDGIIELKPGEVRRLIKWLNAFLEWA